ncbi:MAG: ferrous iron transport protein B [Synergistetes bacterium]|nr:ferrous iron transport protein B [Synergistota bacterium]MCX8128316.1 ferrous iron transport protein B [Synergistota bacterium]MDW8192635.1 ferrous iron transport protein B [Synergistota bacterium]
MEAKIALAGNPNSGKTTVFNILCGTREKVGNWPGTTVEKKEGILDYKGKKIKVIDLPGIYSLSAYSIDERIARDFLIQERPDLVVVIIDATNLERNLYLASQLLEMGLNLLLDFNMMDMVYAMGLKIDNLKLSQILGVEIVETVANQGIGIENLKEKILENISKRPKPLKINYGKEVEEAIERIENMLKENYDISISPRSVALRLLEGDPDFKDKFIGKPLSEEIERIILETENKIEKIYGESIESFIIEKRYSFLKGLTRECTNQKEVKALTFSDKLDKILLNKFLSFPIFLSLMYLLFYLVFYIGNPLADLIDTGFASLRDYLKEALEDKAVSPWLISFLLDGVLAGVGSVLVFLPNIALLFLGVSVLEDSGYLARAAFIMDRVMHTLGLHGKSFIPLLLGFGCNVPAIMATRTLESRKDRLLTILIIPLMSCSARLPVYVLFASAFFQKHQGLIIFSLYLTGILLALIVAKVAKSLFFKEESAPFVMELPPYRLPALRNILLQMWLRSLTFIKRAGTVIALAVILIWMLSSLPIGVEYASENSVIGAIGKTIAPIFKPAGFGTWQASVALLFGIVAKETVIGTLGTLYGAEEESLKEILKDIFTPLSAYAFMLMTLIYIPCIATIATIKKESSLKFAMITTLYSLILGWIVSVLFYQIGSLL